MKTIHVLILSSALTLPGCTSYWMKQQWNQAMERSTQRAKNEQYMQERRAAVLTPGTLRGLVIEAWGNPYRTTTASNGAHTVEVLQFGECAFMHGITSGVLFVKFIDGQVVSYSTTQC